MVICCTGAWILTRFMICFYMKDKYRHKQHCNMACVKSKKAVVNIKPSI